MPATANVNSIQYVFKYFVQYTLNEYSRIKWELNIVFILIRRKTWIYFRTRKNKNSNSIVIKENKCVDIRDMNLGNENFNHK